MIGFDEKATASKVEFRRELAARPVAEKLRMLVPSRNAPEFPLSSEYPRAEGDPYYPMPRPESAALHARYEALAQNTPGVHFIGRLATYKDYNMDHVVAQALTFYKKHDSIREAAFMMATRFQPV